MCSQSVKTGSESALYDTTTGGKGWACALDLFDGSSICVSVNLQRVTHTPGIAAGVCQFTVSLAHSIPNPRQREEDGGRGREVNLCTYMWNVSIIYISQPPPLLFAASSPHARMLAHLNKFRRHLFPDMAQRGKQIPSVALTTDAIE